MKFRAASPVAGDPDDGAAPASPADRSLPSIVGHAIVVGVVGGLGAAAFRTMIALLHNLFFLGRLDLTYDANVHTPASPWGPAVVLVPVIGSFGVVFLVEHFAPEARGHGVPEVMEAIHLHGGRIRPIVAVVKAAASALSIGTGGSVGREGPIVQIGSAFGSTLGQLRHLSVDDIRLLIAAGSAAGIAATFGAPVGGVLFAVELLMVRLSARALLAVTTAVAVGVAVARTLIGSGFAFDVLRLQVIEPGTVGPTLLLSMLVLGLVCGAGSAGFIATLSRAEDLFERRLRNPYASHAIGMGLVGLLGLGFTVALGAPNVFGVGYATITDLLTGQTTAPLVVVALLVGKWLATVLTLGSGGSGGIFSPSLFMGATAGAVAAALTRLVGLNVEPATLVIAGMAGGVAGITGAVLTAAVIVSELTGDFGAAVPLLLVAGVASATRQALTPTNVYTEKLRRRGVAVPGPLELRALQGTSAAPVAPDDQP